MFTEVITGRKKHEEAREEARKFLQNIIDNIPQPIVVKDEHLKVIEANRAVEKICGVGPDKMIGLCAHEFLDSEIAQKREAHDRLILQSETETTIEQELDVPCKNGDILHTVVRKTVFKDARGKRYIVTVMNDITEKIRTMDVLKTLNHRLQRSNEELDEFAHIVSHDLKEPVRGISNYAKFLLEDHGERLDAQGHEFLKDIQMMTEKMSDTIESLYSIARLQSMETRYVETDFNLIVNDVSNSLASVRKEQNVKIKIEGKLPKILCDKTRMTEVVQNLIVNGIKYNNADDKVITIGHMKSYKGRDLGKNGALYVKDNGIGVPAEFHDRIFKIFKRLHNQDEYGGGTGAGLAIVKRILDRDGLSIWLESAPERGSCFYVELPDVRKENHYGN